jgi:8-oxo-dGTP diphosphatase
MHRHMCTHAQASATNTALADTAVAKLARMPSVRIPNISVVRAAGGIVVRDGRVLLVHRPAYGDWTLPKGKLVAGESWEEGALREVEEETGLHCDVGDEVGRTRYVDSSGRNKEVRYFRMTSDDEPSAQNEVDEVRWVSLDEADAVLSYDRDRALLSSLR